MEKVWKTLSNVTEVQPKWSRSRGTDGASLEGLGPVQLKALPARGRSLRLISQAAGSRLRT